jgi:replicative DNA helicase
MRRPLSDLESERALIGGVLLAPKRLVELDRVRPDDFAARAHAAIWTAMLAVSADHPEFDAVMIQAWLARAGALDDAVKLALRDAEEATLSAANLDAHADAVLDVALRRRIVEGCDRLLEQAPKTDGRALAAEAERIMLQAGERSVSATEPVSLFEATLEALREIDDARKGTGIPRIKTGLPALDDAVGGLGPGELAILAARPGVGKTSLALQWLERAARDGCEGLLFSAEMRRARIALRHLTGEAKVSVSKVKRGKLSPSDLLAIETAATRTNGLPVWIADSTAVSLREIVSVARRAKRRRPKLGLVVVDYLQLVSHDLGRGATRELEVSAVARGLKNLAGELDVAILALSQLGRGSEREKRPPRLSDLRESGEIEQAADAVFFIHRDADAAPGEDEGKSVEVELIVGKAREGEAGIVVPLWFFSKWTRFGEREWAKPDPQPEPARRRRASWKNPSHLPPEDCDA